MGFLRLKSCFLACLFSYSVPVHALESSEVSPLAQSESSGAASGGVNPASAKSTLTTSALPPSIKDKRSRVRRDTAYTLAPRQWAASTGILGMGVNEIYGSLGLSYGFEHGLQLGANLLHLGAGVVNAQIKWNFIERGPWALSVGFSPLWLHGAWVWVLPDEGVNLGNIDVVVLPLTVTGSWQAFEHLEFDLQTRYAHSELFGDLSSSSLIFDAQMGLRQFSVTPTVRFHIQKKASVFFRAKLPLWSQMPGSVEAEFQLRPGVSVGGRSEGTFSPKFSSLYLLSLGARSRIVENTFIEFALNYGGAAETFYGSAIYPELNAEFRF